MLCSAEMTKIVKPLSDIHTDVALYQAERDVKHTCLHVSRSQAVKQHGGQAEQPHQWADEGERE